MNISDSSDLVHKFTQQLIGSTSNVFFISSVQSSGRDFNFDDQLCHFLLGDRLQSRQFFGRVERQLNATVQLISWDAVASVQHVIVNDQNLSDGFTYPNPQSLVFAPQMCARSPSTIALDELVVRTETLRVAYSSNSTFRFDDSLYAMNMIATFQVNTFEFKLICFRLTKLFFFFSKKKCLFNLKQS